AKHANWPMYLQGWRRQGARGTLAPFGGRSWQLLRGEKGGPEILRWGMGVVWPRSTCPRLSQVKKWVGVLPISRFSWGHAASRLQHSSQSSIDFPSSAPWRDVDVGAQLHSLLDRTGSFRLLGIEAAKNIIE